MTCQEFWNGEPQALDHLTECAACAGRQQLLTAGLKRLGTEMRQMEAPLRVEQRLVAGFRGHAAVSPARRPGGWWWAASGWAAAILLTTGLALFVAAGRQPERTERITRHATQLAEVELPADLEAADDGFVPLPNAEAIAPNEEINVVRIEAPRWAMIALGYAVSADQAAESIEADVALGADGVARAIRFLE